VVKPKNKSRSAPNQTKKPNQEAKETIPATQPEAKKPNKFVLDGLKLLGIYEKGDENLFDSAIKPTKSPAKSPTKPPEKPPTKPPTKPSTRAKTQKPMASKKYKITSMSAPLETESEEEYDDDDEDYK